MDVRRSSQKYNLPLFHGGNTGSNPVGDANKNKGIENRPKVVNRKAFACFKDLTFYPPCQSLGEQCVLKAHAYDEAHLRAMPVRS